MTKHSGTTCPSHSRCRKHIAAGVLFMLMLCHTGLLLRQGYGDGATWDEVGHFAAGLSHWYDGKFRMYCVNPPFVRLIACAPVALTSGRIDMGLYAHMDATNLRPEFVCGRRAAEEAGAEYFWLLTMARWACIPFSLLGMLVCYWWARDLFGSGAGLLSATLWAFSPSMLAYGHLITPDMGATALGAAAAYCFWKWLRAPHWGMAIGMGLLLGLTLLTKSTWVVLVGLWPALLAACRWSRRDRREAIGRESAQLIAAFLVALWLVNLGYGFEGSFKRLRDYHFVSQSLGGPEPAVRGGAQVRNRFANSALGALPVPVPENYLLGIDYVKMEYERKYWSYLRGEWRFGGWWYYYLYAMLVKEPLGTWALGLLAAGVVLIRRQTYAAAWRDELVLLAPALVVLAMVSSQTGFNHHLRYVLPAFPFLFIAISRVAKALPARHWAVAVVAAGALGWSIISSLSVVPHSMSYFNELAGGPKKGHWHLGNSNADWGQDLLYLKKWYDKTPQARPLHLGYDLPLIDPAMLGIDWRELPCGPTWEHAKTKKPEELGPLPGWFVVSVNQLHTGDQHKYDYFHDLEPVDWVGYTLPVYHITLDHANALRRRYGMPELGMPPAAAPATRPTTREVHHVRADDSKAHQAKP